MDNQLSIKKDAFDAVVARVRTALETVARQAANQPLVQVELESSVRRRIDLVEFNRAIQYCRSRGLVMEEHEPELAVSFVNVNVPKGHPPLAGIRVSVIGTPHILEYANTNDLARVPLHAVRIIRKSRMHGGPAVDVPGYDLRVSLRLEESCTNVNFDPKIIRTSPKTYRLKNRVSFTSPDGMFRYDMTRVRSSSGTSTSVAASELAGAPDTYEVEVELIKTDMDVSHADATARKLLQHTGMLVSVMTGSPAMIPYFEAAAVLDAWQKLFGKKRLPQPITLMHEHVLPADQLPPNGISVLTGYTVTDKADGERHALFVTQSGKVYLLPPRSLAPVGVKYVGVQLPQLAGTVLDGELIYPDMFAAFDVYYLKGKDVRSAPLIPDRRDMVSSVISELADVKTIKFRAKRFRSAEGADMFEACRQALDDPVVGDVSYHIDGLIFTPVGSLDQAVVFKWKPPEENSIDFLAQCIKVTDVATTYALFCKSTRRQGVISALQYLETGNAIANANGHSRGKQPFLQLPTMVVPHADKWPRCRNGDVIDHVSIVECVVENGTWLPLRVRFDKLQDMQRTKAITANAYDTAMDVYKSIMHPLSRDQIIGRVPVQAPDSLDVYYNRREEDSARNLRSFHNFWVKWAHVLGRAVADAKKRTESVRVLDVGCGKGGDIRKLAMLGVTEVLGIDTVADNLENNTSIGAGAYARLAQTQASLRKELDYIFVGIDAKNPFATRDQALAACISDDYKRVCEVLWDPSAVSTSKWHGFAVRPFDVASMQFCLHYWFADPRALDALCASLSRMVSPGGLFVGTCMDGAAIDEAFQESDVVTGEATDGSVVWRMQKKYSDVEPFAQRDPSANYNKRISMYMASINQVLDEWLIDTRELTRVMEKHGFALEGITPFKEIYTTMLTEQASLVELTGYSTTAVDVKRRFAEAQAMTDAERAHSFFNVAFAYRKK